MAFVIERIQGQYGKPVTLLRQAWREGKTIRRKTIANLTPLSPAIIKGFRTALKGGIAVPNLDALMTIRRSYPHGHVVAVLGMAKAQPGTASQAGLGAWERGPVHAGLAQKTSGLDQEDPGKAASQPGEDLAAL